MVSALRRALDHHKLDVAHDLVSRPGSLEASEEALVLVVRNGKTDLARCLLNSPQHAACADCRHGEALVQAAEDTEALVAAARRGHIEIVRILLDARQNVRAHRAALLGASEGGHREVVALLQD
eukprot:gene4917-biopygen15225